ncbi:hypothetical protein K438DRAFT_1991535 [Mycena galopus ATCC 62051]|nr:hypothetical protein K438DRAFT_1991535 [Mycena galopus ATCC 62051]
MGALGVAAYISRGALGERACTGVLRGRLLSHPSSFFSSSLPASVADECVVLELLELGAMGDSCPCRDALACVGSWYRAGAPVWTGTGRGRRTMIAITCPWAGLVFSWTKEGSCSALHASAGRCCICYSEATLLVVFVLALRRLLPVARHTATAPTGSNTVPVAKNTTHNMPQNTPAFPPGLPPLSPPGLTRNASGSTSTASSSSASSEAPAYLPVTALTAGFVGISLSPSMEANLYGVAVETSPDPGAYVAEWEKMPAEDVDALWPSAYKPGDGGDLYEYVVKDNGGKGGAAVENLWGDEPDDNAKVNAKPPNDVVCTVHGIICKKGICSERARLIREKERAEKLENERAGKGKGGGGWSKAGAGGRGKSGNSNGGGWEKKKGNPWQPDDDSGSATGSEGRGSTRSPATPKNDGWATVRR